MAKYERIVTTDAGLELLENAAYIGGSIEFTTLKTGNGTYDGTEELSTMTDLKNVCQTFGVGSVSKKDAGVTFRVAIDNNNLTEGYKMTELGLYATNSDSEEVLYAIILAETGYEDYVPPYADAPTSITFEAYFELTESTEAVTFTAASMEGVYVPAESFNEHVSSKKHIEEEERTAWNAKLDTTGNVSNTTAAFKEATELTELTTGEKLSVAFGKIAKAISSLISHLADATIHHSHSNKSVLDNTTASYTAEEKTKLSNIAAGANAYTHPTTSGNKHIPSGGASGQILRWSADGTAAWGADSDTKYGVVSTTADGLAPKRDGSTTKFLRADGTWAVPPDTNTVYTHPNSGATAGTYRSVTVNAAGHVTAGSNPTVTVAQGGTGATTAAAARTNLGITPANIGAAASSHTHNYAGSSSAGGAATSAVSAATTTPTTASLKNIYAGTSALTAGSSVLTTGTIYVQYE